MKTISIPYYTSTLDLHVDEANLKAVVTAKMHEYKAGKTEVELVHEALEHPIASPRLRDLAKGKQKVVLVTSDHTRAVPSKITLPILLDEIRQGNPDADITILIATGLHRPTTEEEQRRMFGDAIVDHEKIAINNAFDPDQFIHMGVLPSGADFNVNKLAAECDLLVTEGFIEPHFFAGFSGGRKSVLPGVCAANASARHHHCGRGGCEPPTPQGLLPLRLRPQARLAAHLIAAPQSVSASVRILPLAGTFWTFFGLPAGGFLHSLEGFGQYGGIWQSRFLH